MGVIEDIHAYIDHLIATCNEPPPTLCFFLHPNEWLEWEHNGWFIHHPDGRVLSNNPYEPAGFECHILHLLPLC